ncbi:hypothetical protein [Lutibacter sp.]|uniref:hypothetical protein n=1 Tax=Lutibacter sp. TaxID=1925666 RepID=UPI003564BFD2
MSIIHSIITTLSKEEKTAFVYNLKLRNKRSDTKNIELFKLLSTSSQLNGLDILLYDKPSKGAYHALCKRLHDSLIDFIATKSFDKESSEEMSALKLVMASRIFFKQDQTYIAFKTLAKAELIAVKYSLFSILNEIYHTQILHAHLNSALNLEQTIGKWQANKLDIHQEDNLNLFYASIQAELNESNPKVADIINRNLQLFNISISENLSYQSLFKILQISNQVAHITRDYYAIFPFIEDACRKIETSERSSNKHLFDHLQILYYLANTYFRVKNLKEAEKYLQAMLMNMHLENKKYYTIFYPQYAVIENLVLIYSGKNEEAIKNSQIFNFEKYKNKQVSTLDLKLTFVVSLFLNENFKEALKVYQDFYHNDQWYINKIGYIWVIQKNLIEILLLIELDYFELVESRLNGFRKKYTEHLKEHNETIVLEFLKLITIYYYKTENIYSEAFIKKVDVLLLNKRKEIDIFTISFYSWLKAKIEKTELYKTNFNFGINL